MLADPREFLNPGSILLRKDPAGDEWDRVVVSGFVQFENEGGPVEVVLRPLDFGEAIHADVESVNEVYVLAAEGQPEKHMETPLEDVIGPNGEERRRDSTITDPGYLTRAYVEARKSDEEPSFKVQAFKDWKEQQTNNEEEQR